MSNPAPVIPDGTTNIFSQNPLSASGGINGLLTLFESYLLLIAGAIVVIMIIWGGLRYITAAGDAKKAESGRKIVLSAVIGLIIVVTAYFFTRLAAGLGEFFRSQASGSTDLNEGFVPRSSPSSSPANGDASSGGDTQSQVTGSSPSPSDGNR